MVKKTLSVLVLAAMLVLTLGFVVAGTIKPSVWTTKGSCGDESQAVNQYIVGDVVYINGKNFNAGNYNWDIAKNPYHVGDQVVSGTFNVPDTNTFCLLSNAYTTSESGEYKAEFGDEKQNFHVNENLPAVPEFGIVVGMLTALGALGIFFTVMRK